MSILILSLKVLQGTTLASQHPFCSLCEFLPWALHLATFVAGVQHKEDGCVDHVTVWMLADQQSNLVLWHSTF
jgi:hypothetical protein